MNDLEMRAGEANGPREELSPAGRARKAALLAALQAELRGRRGYRLASRWGGAAALALLAAAFWIALRPIEKPAAGVRPPISVVSPVIELKNARFEIVSSAKTFEHVQVQILDDDQLLAALAAANRPTGLLRAGQRVILTEDVAGAGPIQAAEHRDRRDG